MAATLSAGVNSLILKLDQPYDRVRTTDARDDLQKVRVWCSTTSGFTPSDSNKVFDALSLSIVITKITTDGTTFTSLVAGTTYYVKYAFISNIDDTSATAFTVSSQLTATPVTAQAVEITVERQAFVVLKNTTTATPDTIVLTANAGSFTSPTYTWLVDNVAPTLAVGVASGNTFTLNKFTDVRSKTIKVTVTEGTTSLFDIFTIYSLREGDDSIAAGLTNENQTVTCDSSGTPISGQFPITSQFVVLRGTAVLTNTDGVTWSKVSETGMTSTIAATTGIISVTAISAVSASATYRATIGTITIDKVLTINKSNNGTNGSPGGNGTDGAVAVTKYILVNSVSLPSAPTITAGAPASGSIPTGSTTGTWYESPPTVAISPNYWMFQASGTLSAAGTYTWTSPAFLATFKVGSLSALSADIGTITAGNITGVTLQTTSTTSRIQIDSVGLRAFNQAGLEYLGITTGYSSALNINGNRADNGGALYGLYVTNAGANSVAAIGASTEVGSSTTAVQGTSSTGIGVDGSTTGSYGVRGTATTGVGIRGTATSGVGVEGVVTINNLFSMAGNFYHASGNQVNLGTSTNAIKATGSIVATGNIIAYNSSDRTLKTNIVRIPDALSKLNKIGGYTFDWTDSYLSKAGPIDNYFVRKNDVGVIAQEILQVCPEAVAVREDGTLAVNYEKLIPLLIESILELQRKIK